jgi:hypothetical protein
MARNERAASGLLEPLGGEPWAQMDVDLTQLAVPELTKPWAGRAGRSRRPPALRHAHPPSLKVASPPEDEEELGVVVPMQPRAAPGLGVDEDHRRGHVAVVRTDQLTRKAARGQIRLGQVKKRMLRLLSVGASNLPRAAISAELSATHLSVPPGSLRIGSKSESSFAIRDSRPHADRGRDPSDSTRA